MDSGVSKKLDKFFQRYTNKKYNRREILIRAADEPEGLFYLKEGVVRQYAIATNGDELTVNIFKPISMFPMSWVVNGSNSPHFFEAMTGTNIWIAPKEEALKFFKEEPDILFDLVKRIYKGLEGYSMVLEHLMLGSAKARLTAVLLIYARRFGKQIEDTTQINFKLTERDMAAQSGIARETVSRELQKLKQKGIIHFEKNKLSILGIQKLEEELLQT